MYLTFLGGSASQSGGLIAVDAMGNMAITGTTTSPDFPVTDGSSLTSGTNDVTVSEIDPTGSTLFFRRFLAAAERNRNAPREALRSMRSDNIYVATDTSSTDLAGDRGRVPAHVRRARVATVSWPIFQPSATPSLIYCSYLGTNASAQIGVGGVAIDASSERIYRGIQLECGERISGEECVSDRVWRRSRATRF